VIIWEKVLRVKVKKIRQHLIRPVEDVGNTHFIVVNDIVQVVVLKELLSFVNQVGVIDIALSMEIRASVNKIFKLFLNYF
jgi:hypothetical protein